MTFLRAVAISLTLTLGCAPNDATGPCDGVDCSAGRCLADGDSHVCLCDEGAWLTPDGVCRDEGLCSQNPCVQPGRTECIETGPKAYCACSEGFAEVEGECLQAAECGATACTGNGVAGCALKGGVAVCACRDGHLSAPGGCFEQPTWSCADWHVREGDDPFEPDECPSLAAELSLNSTESGLRNLNSSDRDWMLAPTLPGVVYRVRVLTDAPVRTELLSAALQPIASVVSPTPLGFRATGATYVRVKTEGPAAASYSVVMELAPKDDAPEEAGADVPVFDSSPLQLDLGHIGDTDVVGLSIPWGRIYEVRARLAEGAPLTLDALAPDGSRAVRSMSGASPVVRVRAASSTHALIRVRAVNPQTVGAYSLEWADLGADDHGDIAAEATVLTALSVAGTFEHALDVDAFTFEAQKGEVYSLKPRTSAREFFAGVIGQPGSPMSVSQPAEAAYFEATASGRVTLLLRPVTPYQGPASYAAVLTNHGIDDFGDDVATATPIAADGVERTGRTELPGDIDVFSVDGGATHAYTFECSSCLFQVHSSSGQLMATSWQNKASFSTDGAQRLFIKLDAASSVPTTYTYRLTDLGADDHPNYPVATARVLGVDPVDGTLGAANDVDVFAFDASAGRAYGARCLHADLKPCGTTFLNPGGSTLSQNSSVRISAAGRYYVSAFPLPGSIVAPGSRYTIRVEDLGPDDWPDQQSNAATISVPSTTNGIADIWSFDEDWLVFQATSGIGYEVAISSDTPVGSSVIDSYGISVANNPFSVGPLLRKFVFDRPSNGPVYIKLANPYSGFPRYSVRTESLGTDEYGDSVATATAAALSGPSTTVTGVLQSETDRDFLSLPPVQGHVYLISTTNAPMLNVYAPGSSAPLTFYSPGRAYEANSGSPFVVSIGTLASNPRWSFQVDDIGVDDHGDDVATATTAAFGTKYGRFETAGDADYLEYAVQIGRTYEFKCSAPQARGCWIGVRSTTDASLAEPPFVGPTETVVRYTASANGSVFLRAGPWIPDSSPPFAFTVVAVDLGGGDDHGNSYADATAVTVAATAAGNIEVVGDVDYFSASLTAATPRQISSTGIALAVTVYGPSPSTVVAGPLQTPLTFTPASTGTYYLRAQALDGTATGTYQVTVQ